jgi:hypothetical protein
LLNDWPLRDVAMLANVLLVDRPAHLIGLLDVEILR